MNDLKEEPVLIKENLPVRNSNDPAPPAQPIGNERPGEANQGTGESRSKELPVMMHRRIIGIKLARSCNIFRLIANVPTDLQAQDELLLDTVGGEQLGRVTFVSEQDTANQDQLFPGPIKRVIRRFSAAERERLQLSQAHEPEIMQACKEEVRELRLEMRLSRVSYAVDCSKVVVYFTAENRVDFRELVRRLVRRFKIRVEMRQIGVRDETKLLGGLGPCGQIFCCSRFLKEFHQVSVRMAKNQNLSLSPETISGVCGRLLCCLSYENDVYLEMHAKLPKINTRLWTKEGQPVVVRGLQPLPQILEVQFEDGVRQRMPVQDLLAEAPATTTPTIDDSGQPLPFPTSTGPSGASSGPGRSERSSSPLPNRTPVRRTVVMSAVKREQEREKQEATRQREDNAREEGEGGTESRTGSNPAHFNRISQAGNQHPQAKEQPPAPGVPAALAQPVDPEPMGKGNQPDQGSDKTAFRNRRRRPRPRKPGQPDGSSSPESNP